MSIPKKYSGRPQRRGPLRPQRAPARPVAPTKPKVEPEPEPEPVKMEAVAPVVEPEPEAEAEVAEVEVEEEAEEAAVEPEPEAEESKAEEPEVAWKASMRKAELLSIAVDLGLEVTDSNTKAEILDALDGTTT